MNEAEEFLLTPVKDEETQPHSSSDSGEGASGREYCLVTFALKQSRSQMQQQQDFRVEKRLMVRSTTEQGVDLDLTQNPDLLKALEAFVPGPVRDAIKSGWVVFLS